MIYKLTNIQYIYPDEDTDGIFRLTMLKGDIELPRLDIYITGFNLHEFEDLSDTLEVMMDDPEREQELSDFIETSGWVT